METFLIRPNRARWDRRGVACVGTLLGLATAIWVAYAWMGAWPILVFGVIELVGMAVLGYGIKRHLRDYEHISIGPGVIVLTRATGEASSCHEFPTYWTRLDYRSAGGWYPKRLRLRFRDHETEVAASMTEANRDVFALTLARALANARSAEHLQTPPHQE